MAGSNAARGVATDYSAGGKTSSTTITLSPGDSGAAGALGVCAGSAGKGGRLVCSATPGEAPLGYATADDTTSGYAIAGEGGAIGGAGPEEGTGG